ncbi:MAG: hypothetical protein WDO19_01985 [Bacteroidota bacterium]
MSMWFEYPIRKSFQLNIDSLYDFDLFYPILVIANLSFRFTRAKEKSKISCFVPQFPIAGTKQTVTLNFLQGLPNRFSLNNTAIATMKARPS